MRCINIERLSHKRLWPWLHPTRATKKKGGINWGRKSQNPRIDSYPIYCIVSSYFIHICYFIRGQVCPWLLSNCFFILLTRGYRKVTVSNNRRAQLTRGDFLSFPPGQTQSTIGGAIVRKTLQPQSLVLACTLKRQPLVYHCCPAKILKTLNN